MSEARPKGEPVRRRWLRRLWRWGWRGLLCAVVLGLLAVLAVLCTGIGARTALSVGVASYRRMIPGDIRFGSVDGGLRQGLVIADLTLEDRFGRPLLQASRVRLAVDPAALLSLRLDLGDVRVDGARIFALDYEDGGFGDLAPDGPAEVVETDAIGPDLPVEINGILHAGDSIVYVGGVQAPEELANVPALTLRVHAVGRDAAATLAAHGSLPSLRLSVAHVSVGATWSDAIATLDGLRIESNWADVDVQRAELGVASEGFEVSGARVRPTEEWLAANAGALLGSAVELGIETAGAADAFVADLVLETADRGELVVIAEGGIKPQPWLEAWLDTELRRPDEAGGDRLHATVAGSLSALVAGGGDVVLASTQLQCAGCLRDEPPVSLDASAFFVPATSSARVDLNVAGDAARVAVTASLGAGGAVAATADVAVTNLSSLQPTLRALGVDTSVAGDASGELICTGGLSPASGACQVRAQIRQGAPVESARLDTVVSFAEGTWRASVSELLARANGVAVTLRSGPASVAFGDRGLTAKDFSLGVQTATGLGRVSAWAQLDEAWAGSAGLEIRDLDLAAVNAFAPRAGLRGRVNADVGLRAELGHPTASVDLRGRGVGVGAVSIGDVALTSGYRARGLSLRGDLQGGHLGSTHLALDLPVTIDAETGVTTVHPKRPLRASLRTRALDLRAASDLHPSLASLSGTVAIDIGVDGTVARPKASLDVTLTDATLEQRRLPNVTVQGQYAADTARVALALQHPAFRSVRASATVPVHVELATGAVRWLDTREHEVTVDVKAARLVELREWLPAVAIEGIASLHAHAAGVPGAPVMDVEFHGYKLRFDDRPVGRVDLASSYRDGIARLKAFAAGPAVTGIGLAVSVPFAADLRARTLDWDPDRPHELDLSVQGVVLSRLAQWLPEPLAIRGRAGARLRLSGSARAPAIVASVEATELRYGSHAIGTVDAEARYAGDTVDTNVRWNVAGGRHATLSASIPVHVDLPALDFALRPDGMHSVRLSAPRIDRVMLAPFIELGETYDSALAVDLVSDGTVDAFVTSASVTGFVRAGGESQPLGGRVVLVPGEQSAELRLGPLSRPLLRTTATLEGDIPKLVDRTADWKTTPVAFQLETDRLKLAFFEAFVPASIRNIEGTIESQVSVSGRAGAPVIDGTVTIADAGATFITLRQRVRKLGLQLALDNDGARVTKLGFKSGGGRVTGEGRADVVAGVGLHSRVVLDAETLPILWPGLPRMEYSGRIEAVSDYDAESLSIKVGLQKTLIAVLDSGVKSGKPVDTNAGIALVDLSEAAVDGPAAPGNVAPVQTGTVALTVTLEDPLRIVGGGVDMSWEGSVTASRGAEAALVSGGVNVTEGTISLLGNAFTIQRAVVTLPETGSYVPFIDALATTTIDGVEISAIVRGRVSRPELVLSSSAPLSQSEILTALVTGSTDGEEADSEEVAARAASMLVAMSSPALQQQVNERLRVDRVGLSFGETTEQPILTVGKSLTKKLYTETKFHHNAPTTANKAEVKLRYRFAPRWSLETFMGDAAVSGLGVFWGKAFDGKAP